MTPKHLPQSGFNDRQKLPPAATPKVGVKKFDGPRVHLIDWEWPQNASLKAILTFDKNYTLQPPAKLEVTKIKDGNLIKFISNDLKAHLSKPFPQLEKKNLNGTFFIRQTLTL